MTDGIRREEKGREQANGEEAEGRTQHWQARQEGQERRRAGHDHPGGIQEVQGNSKLRQKTDVGAIYLGSLLREVDLPTTASGSTRRLFDSCLCPLMVERQKATIPVCVACCGYSPSKRFCASVSPAYTHLCVARVLVTFTGILEEALMCDVILRHE